MSQANGSLRDQGVVGLQLRQQGNSAEVRLQLRQGGGVVEASLRETTRGVEIQLTAGPDQQPLLRRVAEALANGRGDHAFDLDEVTVDSQGDWAHSQHRSPGDASGDDADNADGNDNGNGNGNGSSRSSSVDKATSRRQRPSAVPPGPAPHPMATSEGTNYLR